MGTDPCRKEWIRTVARNNHQTLVDCLTSVKGLSQTCASSLQAGALFAEAGVLTCCGQATRSKSAGRRLASARLALPATSAAPPTADTSRNRRCAASPRALALLLLLGKGVAERGVGGRSS
eukprot:3790020-Rhodomonas_salina.2